MMTTTTFYISLAVMVLLYAIGFGGISWIIHKDDCCKPSEDEPQVADDNMVSANAVPFTGMVEEQKEVTA